MITVGAVLKLYEDGRVLFKYPSFNDAKVGFFAFDSSNNKFIDKLVHNIPEDYTNDEKYIFVLSIPTMPGSYLTELSWDRAMSTGIGGNIYYPIFAHHMDEKSGTILSINLTISKNAKKVIDIFGLESISEAYVKEDVYDDDSPTNVEFDITRDNYTRIRKLKLYGNDVKVNFVRTRSIVFDEEWLDTLSYYARIYPELNNMCLFTWPEL